MKIKDRVTVLQGIILVEVERLQEYIDALQKEYNAIPKGYLRKMGDYLYRQHREGGRVISTYIGPTNSAVSKLATEQRARALELKAKIKSAKEYITLARRSALHANK